MVRFITSYLLFSLLLLSCSPSKKGLSSAPIGSDSTNTQRAISSPMGDGKSFETAIVINETSDPKGVSAEYQWIRENKSNYRVIHQSLVIHGKKPYDIITIQYSDNTKEDIYFDISKFFK
jgi:hypothetical protein